MNVYGKRLSPGMKKDSKEVTQRTGLPQKAISKEEAFGIASKLVEEAVDVANRAGIDPSSIVAPHCLDTDVKDNNGNDGDSENLTWSGIPVIIDNETDGLFEMPEPDAAPEQKPVFRVTQSTARLVQQDFARYQPSLERMIEDWQEEKNQFIREQANKRRGDKKPVKRSEIKRRK